MKKLGISLLFFFCFGSVEALPVSNPSDASLLCDGFVYRGFWDEPENSKTPWRELFSVRLGFYGDYVLNRHFVLSRIEEAPVLEKSTLFTNAAEVTLNFWDKFDLFTTLGATHLALKGNASLLNAPLSSPFFLNCSTDISWSLGGRCTAWKYGFTSLGIEMQYFRTAPKLDFISLSQISELYFESEHATYREWQIGVGISHRFYYLVPYAALKWSHAKLRFSDITFSLPLLPGNVLTLYNFETVRTLGYVFGVSLIDIEQVSVTAECRFGDEIGLYINTQLRF